MDQWTFGVTTTLVGMGGTLFTLWVLSLVIQLLVKIFPFPKDDASTRGCDSSTGGEP